MGPELLTGSGEELVGLIVFAVVGFTLGFLFGRGDRREKLRGFEQLLAQSERRAADAVRANDDLLERMERAETSVRGLQRSIVEIPKIAERLSSLRDPREIPDGTLDLVQEIFECSYSVFYRVSKGKLVAVASHGESEFRIGHRLDPGAGIVGWTAVRQMPFTPEDAELESAGVRARNLARCMPRQGFSLCVPIMRQGRALGVLLVGPTSRHLPHAKEIGRTIALIASVAIASADVLRQERSLARTDGLTGLLNKSNVYQRLRDAISDEQLARVSVFLLDIDHFKQFNDTHGHLDGDELLKRMGALLRENSRSNEVVGRYGGEEFLVVMPGTSKESAMLVAERIRALVESTNFDRAGGQPAGKVTISGGVATWPTDGEDVDSLLRNADAALYEAKRAGRNQVLACSVPELTGADFDDAYLPADPERDEEKGSAGS
jgi:diguanylate cyclase (GGDEF)-like protein